MVSKSLLHLQNWIFYRPKSVLENFGILTPGDLNFDLSQKRRIWFQNYFSGAFERRFPFCSTMRRCRDRRGGGKQRPIRAQVKFIYKSLCLAALHARFFREALAQSGAKRHRGSYKPPLCRWPVPARVNPISGNNFFATYYSIILD